MSLPFEIKTDYGKGNTHKGLMKAKWKHRGVKWESEEEFDIIYNRYIYSSECELCHNKYKNSRNRHLDHCHDPTGKFRNVVCTTCNRRKKDFKTNSNTDMTFIHKYWRNNRNKYYYSIQIRRGGKKLNNTTIYLEKAIELRDKFMADNPTLFT